MSIQSSVGLVKPLVPVTQILEPEPETQDKGILQDIGQGIGNIGTTIKEGVENFDWSKLDPSKVLAGIDTLATSFNSFLDIIMKPINGIFNFGNRIVYAVTYALRYIGTKITEGHFLRYAAAAMAFILCVSFIGWKWGTLIGSILAAVLYWALGKFLPEL